jgi:hypothetical protein
MTPNTKDAALETFSETKYTRNPTTHKVGDKTSSPNKKPSGSGREAHIAFFLPEMHCVCTFEKHSIPEVVALAQGFRRECPDPRASSSSDPRAQLQPGSRHQRAAHTLSRLDATTRLR